MKTQSKLLNILLIEDDSNDILLIKIALEKKSIDADLKIITNGEEAVKYINKLNEKENLPDLILLDINLPKVTGLEVLKKIKSNWLIKSTPTVVFTSSDSPYDMNYCYQNGADHYVRKPNNIQDFKNLMDGFLKKYIFKNIDY